MPTQISDVVQHLRRAILQHDEAGLTDGQLLGRFIEQRDEAAVAALVRRHGLMVWGVCRRILRTHHDAEDAFQATFLVLVRKAGSVRKREMVGNWLYGVAHQTALKARQTAAKQFARARQVVDMPEPAVQEPGLCCELQAVLDQELCRLPDKYRVGIVLCDLEGKTRKEAARQLGLPEGTLAGRLARGRALLAKRLVRSGLAMPGGALATVLAQQAASAAVPTSVMTSTIKAATMFAAGQATAGLISAKVVTLTEGMVKAMFLAKLKVASMVLLVVAALSGVAGLTYQTQATAQEDKKPTAEKSAKPAAAQEKEKDRDKEIVTAWGKEIGGLQAGLGFRPGENRAYHYGETVTLVVRVRNVGMKEVTFQYWPESDWTHLPDVTDAKGKPIAIKRGLIFPNVSTKKVNLAPGKSIELWQWKLNLRPESESTKPPPPDDPPYATLYGPGKFVIQYPWVSSVSKLGTGKLELEVKSDSPQKQEQKQDKEGYTAWGRVVGGLQAGLGFRPGEQPAYHHGETVTLLVRVRNVGKETVKFKYIRQFLDEKPPTVTDADGKTVPQSGTTFLGFHVPMEVILEPGKEVELESRLPLRYELRPTSGGGNPPTKERPLLVGTGKVSLQYEQVLGNSSAGRMELDPTLSKLATGKLELEVKADPPAPEKKAPQKQEPGDQTAKKFWAGMSVNQPLFRAGHDTNVLQFSFALVNESDKVIDPKIPGYPRLIVNGKELDLTRIPGVGPRDGRFKALPPGDNLQFGMGAGQFFDKPGVYRVYWQGEEFRSNEVVFRVMK